MNKKNLALLLAGTMISVSLAGCGTETPAPAASVSESATEAVTVSETAVSESVETESVATSSVQTEPEEVEEIQALTAEPVEAESEAAAGNETKLMNWKKDDVFGVVYLGGADSWATLKSDPSMEAVYAVYPEIREIGSVIDMFGEEYYAIIPRYQGQVFSYYGVEMDGNGNLSVADEAALDLTSDGRIQVLHCNVSDLYSNVQITATAGDKDARSITWQPYISLRDGQIDSIDGNGVHVRNFAAINPDTLAETWSYLTGWGPGVAGGSLKTAGAAVRMMEWASEIGVRRYEGTEVKDAYQNWYNGLDDLDKKAVDSNLKSVLDFGDRVLAGDSEIQGTLNDAGVAEMAADFENYSDLDHDWAALRADVLGE